MNEGIMQTDVQQIQGSDVGEAVEPRNRAYATQRVYSQVEKPTGLGGRVAGWFMAHRTSDRERNEWAVSLLELQPTDRVLEIGFGPGVAIALMSRVVTSGSVVGIDHSEVMLQQAKKRNASAIEQGRVQLRLASVADFPTGHGRYDKCLMVNAFHYCDNSEDILGRVQRQMNPGGKIVIAFQPCIQGSTSEDVLKAGHTMLEKLKASGFSRTHFDIKSMAPDSVACVVGVRES